MFLLEVLYILIPLYHVCQSGSDGQVVSLTGLLVHVAKNIRQAAHWVSGAGCWKSCLYGVHSLKDHSVVSNVICV